MITLAMLREVKRMYFREKRSDREITRLTRWAHFDGVDCVFVVNVHSAERSAVPAGRVPLLRISRAVTV